MCTGSMGHQEINALPRHGLCCLRVTGCCNVLGPMGKPKVKLHVCFAPFESAIEIVDHRS